MSETQKQWSIIIISALVGIALATYKMYHVFLPAASEYIADQIPSAIYQAIGESTLQSLDEKEFKQSQLSTERQQQVQTQYTELLTKLHLPVDQHKLYLRNWQGKMNAFALMDGSVVVTDALVTNLTSKQQLDAVLLHEMGHIENNHLMENTIRVSLFYISMSLFFGDISVVSDLLIESSAMSINLSYSRDFEQQADLYASQKLQAFYGSTDAMVAALEVLYQHNDEETPSWFSTHPSLVERVKNVQQQGDGAG